VCIGKVGHSFVGETDFQTQCVGTVELCINGVNFIIIVRAAFVPVLTALALLCFATIS